MSEEKDSIRTLCETIVKTCRDENAAFTNGHDIIGWLRQFFDEREEKIQKLQDEVTVLAAQKGLLEEELARAKWEGDAAILAKGQMWRERCTFAAGVEKLEEENKKLLEALTWCGGSRDFESGGVARQGWINICRPLIKKGLDV